MSDQKQGESERELRDKHEELQRRASQKLKDLAEAERAVRELTSRIVDASDKERPGLIAERIKMVGTHDLLLAEHNELTTREDAALLAIYQYRVDLAREDYLARQEIDIRARQARDAAGVEMRIWLNGGRSKLPQAEGDQRDKELRTRAAGLQADMDIARRELLRAGQRQEIALQELEEVRGELGIEKAGRS